MPRNEVEDIDSGSIEQFGDIRDAIQRPRESPKSARRGVVRMFDGSPASYLSRPTRDRLGLVP